MEERWKEYGLKRDGRWTSDGRKMVGRWAEVGWEMDKRGKEDGWKEGRSQFGGGQEMEGRWVVAG